MDLEQYMSLCVLGRQPKLGLAELESLYGAKSIRPINGGALLDVAVEDIDFRRLGGTLKLARVLTILPSIKWADVAKYLIDNIPKHLEQAPEGKFTLGLSAYNLDISPNDINRTGLTIKKAVKASGRPFRLVPNKQPELNSAQVLHNNLTTIGAWELLLFGEKDQTIVAQTLFVQDIEAYAGRDQARPKRDARVGMLPPKLAQMIINLAKPPTGATVLDPFCGTGVVLQEALLDGFSVYGTDLEPRMVEYSQANLDWLKQKTERQLGEVRLDVADATAHTWVKPFESLASEAYLGRAFTASPKPEVLKQNVADVNLILKKFLKNLSAQVPAGFRLCLAVPAWMAAGRAVHLPLLEQLTDMGYNRVALKHVSFDDLIYAREGQFVGRELVILERS